METIVAKLAKGNKGVDGSFTKLAVKKFPEDVRLEERIEAMLDFTARSQILCNIQCLASW